MRPSTLEKIKSEAQIVGLSFFQELKGTKNIYKFDSCGHTQTICTSKVRLKQFQCQSCFIEKLKIEARQANITLLQILSGKKNLYLFPNCGHTKELVPSHVRSNSFKCDDCLFEKENDDAIKNDLILVKRINGYKNIYKFKKCNHEQHINKYHVATGTFQCHTCQNSYASKKSGVYLLHIEESSGFSWLKFGVARNLDKRIKEYKLSDANVSVISYNATDTNKEAIAFEKKIHKKFFDHKINPDTMKLYMKSGFSECYPVYLKSLLNKELSLYF